MQLSRSQLRQIITDYVHGSDHPDLVVYRRDFGTKFDLDRWIETMERNCNLGQLQEKRILEVGCGFGWDAAGLSLVGNNTVVATDILPSMIDGARECIESSIAKGHNLKVEARQGDICSLDLPDTSFDGIYSSEAIEHVHDLTAMFARCYQLLKPGGRMLIINDSNQWNSEFREATFEMWKERDESWEHARWLTAEIRPIEHANAKPYAAMREQIIRESGIEFDDTSISKLVAATAGMIRPGILEAATIYKHDRILPERPKFSWCRNPETGEYAERLLDPFELRAMIKAAGFKNVKLRHGFNKFPHRLLNGIAFRPLNKFLFDRRGAFILIADKPSGS